jgi:hypothetical protein
MLGVDNVEIDHHAKYKIKITCIRVDYKRLIKLFTASRSTHSFYFCSAINIMSFELIYFCWLVDFIIIYIYCSDFFLIFQIQFSDFSENKLHVAWESGGICPCLSIVLLLAYRFPLFSLVRPFSFDEIRVALFSMNDNSSPGPDGLGSAFYKRHWELVKHDLL